MMTSNRLVLGAALAAVCLAGPAKAQTLLEQAAEFRMQIDFAVPDAALRKFLPAGWEPAIATQGPAKDCNIRVIFIDRADITNRRGAPTGMEPDGLSRGAGEADRHQQRRPDDHRGAERRCQGRAGTIRQFRARHQPQHGAVAQGRRQGHNRRGDLVVRGGVRRAARHPHQV